MKLYRLPLLLHEPSGSDEDKFLAEVPSLPGCRAWGNTAAEALESLQSVTTAFIQSYRARGDSLPPEVEAAASEIHGATVASEVLVAV